MTDLSGITITTGILPSPMREELGKAVERIGAKIVEGVRIDTTHFVTTEGRGMPWEKAVEMNIPVVRPEWVEACEKTGRILGVTKFYLDAVRPGPSGSDSPSVASPPTPAPAQPAQKDLPQTPAQAEASKKEETKEEEKEETSEDSDSDSDEEAADEEKAKVTDEQKVRLEDKDTQKVALRPAADQVEAEKASTEDADGEDSDKAPAPSPGDGASFQDVAL